MIFLYFLFTDPTHLVSILLPHYPNHHHNWGINNTQKNPQTSKNSGVPDFCKTLINVIGL